jgi:glutaredoxin
MGMLVLSGLGAVAVSADTQQNNQGSQGSKTFTHAVFAEDGTATWCGYCHYAREALDKIFSSGDYPFYYVCLVDDKDTHSDARINEYNVYGFPTVWFDGGKLVAVGGGTGNENQYRGMITSTGARAVADIDVSLNVTWLGDAAMNISASVKNNEGAPYAGKIRIYVTEVQSSMGWYDTSGHAYTFPFLDYALNSGISIPTGDTWTYSTVWDGHNYNDGYGHTFGSIQYGNIFVIAAVFNNTWNQGYSYPPSSNPFSAYYVDDTTGFWVGSNTPPKVPSNPNPVNGATSIDINKDVSWTGGDPDPDHDPVTYDVYFGTDSSPSKVSSNQSALTYDPGTLAYETTYYWKIVSWDDEGASTVGPVWHFTTTNAPNSPPSAPSISGESSGKANTIYTYTILATDPDDDSLYYMVNWGDNTTTDWTGPFDAGVAASLQHTWKEKGTYVITATAKDEHGAIGPAGTLSVTMPLVGAYPVGGFLQHLLERFPHAFPLLRLFLGY